MLLSIFVAWFFFFGSNTEPIVSELKWPIQSMRNLNSYDFFSFSSYCSIFPVWLCTIHCGIKRVNKTTESICHACSMFRSSFTFLETHIRSNKVDLTLSGVPLYRYVVAAQWCRLWFFFLWKDIKERSSSSKAYRIGVICQGHTIWLKGRFVFICRSQTRFNFLDI